MDFFKKHFLCSVSQHTVHREFLMQCSTIHQLRLTPSAHHNTLANFFKTTYWNFDDIESID